MIHIDELSFDFSEIGIPLAVIVGAHNLLNILAINSLCNKGRIELLKLRLTILTI